jgi:branched-chain amino acid transport system permease protein
VVLENGALVGVASTGVGYPAFVDWPPVGVLGVPVSWQIVWIAVGATGVMAALNVFFLVTPAGKAMRAAAANPLAARLVGVRVERMALYAFMLSAGLGAVGGALITPAQFTAFNVGLPFALKGFTAAMIGGFGNVWGAMAGGIIVGVLEAVNVGYVSTKYKDAITFLLLLVILLARPQGLFGSLVEDEERH